MWGKAIKCYPGSREKKQTIGEDPKIDYLLKWSDKDLKITMMKILKNSVWKVNNMSEEMKNWNT